ncbi:RNA polymerase sigma factor [Guggenheimella bovis]
MNIEAIYKRQVDTVYRVAMLYMKNSYDAEDATTQAFLNLMKSPREFDSLEHEKAFLIVTVTNVCKNMLSHWFRKNKTNLEDLEEVLGTNDERDEILEIVLKLPDELKTVLYMYYYEGYKGDEIAKALDINASTVRSRLARARELLRIEWEEE